MSFGAQNPAKSAPYTVDFDVKLWKSPDLKEKKAAFLSKTCFSDDSRTFQRAADFIFLFDLLIWHQKVRGNFVINHRFRDYRSPRLKGQKLASYKVLISSIGVAFGHILEKWWFEYFMKSFLFCFCLRIRTHRDLLKMLLFIKKWFIILRWKKVDKVGIFGFCGNFLNMLFVEFADICKFRSKIAPCPTYPRRENPKIRRYRREWRFQKIVIFKRSFSFWKRTIPKFELFRRRSRWDLGY